MTDHPGLGSVSPLLRWAVVVLLLLILPISKPSCAFEVTADLLDKYSVDLSKETLFLNDPDNRLSPESVVERMSQADFQSDPLIATGQQYWFYIPLINRTDTPQWAIRDDHILFDELDFYLHCQGQALQHIPRPALGLYSPTLASNYFIPVTLPKDNACGFLQRGRTPVFDGVRINLMPHATMAWQSNLKTTLALLGIGVVSGLIFYNLLLYLLLRDSMYLIYIAYAVLHLTGIILLHFNPEPLGSLFGSGRNTLWVLGTLTVTFFVLFTLRFMQPGIQQLRDQSPKSYLYAVIKAVVSLKWLVLTSMILFLLSSILYPEVRAQLSGIYPFIYVGSLLLVPLLSFLVALSGYRPAWVFLPAWTILIVSHILYALESFRVINLHGMTPTYGALAAALEMVLLSIALGIAIKGTQAARDRAQLARENAELRMQQQERFVSTLSHEIRTPLHAMLGSTNLLGRTPLSEQQKNYWSTTHYAAESMYELVDNLLDRTQAKQAQITDKNTVFNPQRLLEAMIRLLRNRAEEKQLDIHLHTRELPQLLVGKPVILRRMLINLISNAIKYTDSGTITVNVEWLSASKELHVQVEDTGQGMSPEQLEQVKARFNVGVESLYSQNASSGLGLPICFEMIKAAGGYLLLNSQLGQGTQARFYLHMSLPTATDQELVTPDTPEKESDRPLKVLIVDDVASNRMITRELLASAGHTVTQAEEGRQALLLLQEQAFDAVLSDVRMPGMDGVTLLAELRRKYSRTELAIVMTSAHFDQQQREQLLSMGANVCLSKPYIPAELLASLQEATPENNSATAAGDIFSHIKGRLGEEKTGQVVALYRAQLQEDVERITCAAGEQDENSIRVAAHRIVSASRALGLHDKAEAALQLEIFEEDAPVLNWESFRALIAQNKVVLQQQI